MFLVSIIRMPDECTIPAPKGQKISEANFLGLVSSKEPTNFSLISAPWVETKSNLKDKVIHRGLKSDGAIGDFPEPL